MVEVGIQQVLPDVVSFVNEHRVVQVQKIEYEWKSVFCEKCLGYGHQAVTCRKLTGRKIWVQKKKPDEEGFTLVRKQKVRANETDIVLTTHNSFIAL